MPTFSLRRVWPVAYALVAALCGSAAPRALPAAHAQAVPTPAPLGARGAPGVPGSAVGPSVIGVRQLGGDAVAPAVTIIECRIATERDVVTVYRTTGAMEWSSDWQRATNFDGSVWTFDIGSTGRPQLAIAFSRVGDQVTAKVYPELGTAGSRAPARMTPPALPALAPIVLTTTDSWTLPDGSVRPRLTVSIDSAAAVPLTALTAGDGQSTIAVPQAYAPKYDGRTDWSVEVGVSPGVGLYEVWQSHIGAPLTYAFFRSYVAALPQADRMTYASSAFWPFLGDVRRLGRETRDVHPPLIVDWKRGRVEGVAQFIPGVAPENGWNISSLLPLVSGQVNALDFENPFGFYDLAGRGDGRPDLQVRIGYFPPGDPYFLGGRSREPRQVVRYSWDQEHRRLWDYKLDLVGAYPLGRSVAFPGFEVVTVPYDELPKWITSKRWSSRAFVAREQIEYWTAEGIYVWDAAPALSDEYLTGLTDAPDLSYYRDIDEGFRGEFSIAPDEPVLLYFSPIDRRLHLLNAKEGVWNLGGLTRMRYANLGGPYVNQWRYERDGQKVGTLTFASGQLVASTTEGVQVRSATAPPAVFTAQPPSDPAQWVELGGLLRTHAPPAPTDSLQEMFDQFEGPVLTLPGAAASDFALSRSGFSFVLDVPAESIAQGVWLTGLVPGANTIVFTQGVGYAVVAPVAPRIELDLVTHPAAPVHRQAVTVDVRIEGITAEVAHGLRVQLAAVEAGTRLDRQTVADTPLVYDGQSIIVATPWSPRRSGTWELTARVVTQAGQVLAERTVQSVVLPSGASPGAVSGLSVGRVMSVLPLLAATALAVTGAVAATRGAAKEGRAAHGR